MSINFFILFFYIYLKVHYKKKFIVKGSRPSKNVKCLGYNSHFTFTFKRKTQANFIWAFCGFELNQSLLTNKSRSSPRPKAQFYVFSGSKYLYIEKVHELRSFYHSKEKKQINPDLPIIASPRQILTRE
jgi:hypothetical protein